jgi:hypothetical protein
MKHMFFVLSVLAFILSARVLLYSLKVASDATKNEISAIPYHNKTTTDDYSDTFRSSF